MIRHVRLLRNVGKFDSVDEAARIDLRRLALIYGENGRGKTTLVAALRSLQTGDPLPVLERRRLSSRHPPHVVLDCEGPTNVVFIDGRWNRTVPSLLIYDDVFVDENVHSGLVVEAGHRQRLHELVLGAEGVALSRRIQDLVGRVEEHNHELRQRAQAIPEEERHGLAVDEFCALEARPEVEREIEESERALAAANAQDAVRKAEAFETLSLPEIDLASIERILGAGLPMLDTAAAERVQRHAAALGAGAEEWLGGGMSRVVDRDAPKCPFCLQDLAQSPLFSHYRAYFSEAYAELKERIGRALDSVVRSHGDAVPAGFERAVRVATERRQFWSEFCGVPDIALQTAVIVRDWGTAREAVAAALRRKQAAPLEPVAAGEAARRAVDVYEGHRTRVAALSAELVRVNDSIGVVKEQAAEADPRAIAANLERLRATRARHSPGVAPLCDAYLRERVAKSLTEAARDAVRRELDGYRTNIFPRYQTAVNLYLQRFAAGFRLQSVQSTPSRGGPSCTYSVVINNTPVRVAGGAVPPGEPSFRNTLSAGDRNTLALAFFFASLDHDPELVNRVVVIDDPISSLDEHRALTTVQEVRRLADRANQVLVLSHDRRFLCRIWEGADPTTRSALEIGRAGDGSTIRAWDVAQDSISEHDRRHRSLLAFVEDGTGDLREVAKSIRPHLEAYLRVACPQQFPPSTLLGPFIGVCRRWLGGQQEILNAARLTELDGLKEYANRFHHDTNPAWETEVINDAELRGFVQRTLAFARP